MQKRLDLAFIRQITVKFAWQSMKELVLMYILCPATLGFMFLWDLVVHTLQKQMGNSNPFLGSKHLQLS